jgi:hypothetical protein
MININEKLTKLAIDVYRSRNSMLPPDKFIPNLYLLSDPILSSAERYSMLMFTMPDNFFEEIFKADKDLKNLTPSNEKENYAFVYTPFSGSRIDPKTFFSSLCGAAFMKMYFFGMEENEENFIISVLKGFNDFKNAIRTRKIEANIIHGVSNINLDNGLEIKTPWGIIKTAPKSILQNVPFNHSKPIPSCIFIETISYPLSFDKADQVHHDEYSDLRNKHPNLRNPNNIMSILPLAFAFASADSDNPIIPVFTWTTELLPFRTGFGYSTYLQFPQNIKKNNISSMKNDIEEWAFRINKEYTPKIDLAIKRIITSVTQRTDPSDSLIDAVMVWENILGTKTEVTFRITASMAKLLEKEPEKKEKTLETLKNIYDMRSRIVHGSIGNDDKIKKYVGPAIGYAIKLLKYSFERGKDWLEKDGAYRSKEILMDLK